MGEEEYRREKREDRRETEDRRQEGDRRQKTGAFFVLTPKGLASLSPGLLQPWVQGHSETKGKL
jgi:hypothetical protein